MTHHLSLRWTRLVPLALVVAACSTAKQGNAAQESASAPVDLAVQGAPAGAETLASTRPLTRPETLPSSDPSLRRDLPAVDTGTSEQRTLARLEREARAIAKTTGCHSAAACRTAPVGVKACGGPRDYLVYCAASTDTVALMRKLDELARAERAYNAHSGMASTCEMRIAPSTTLVGATCREAPNAAPGAGAGLTRLP